MYEKYFRWRICFVQKLTLYPSHIFVFVCHLMDPSICFILFDTCVYVCVCARACMYKERFPSLVICKKVVIGECEKLLKQNVAWKFQRG